MVPLGSRFAFLLREGAWLDEQPAVAARVNVLADMMGEVIQRGRRSGEFRVDLPASFQVRMLLATVLTVWEAVQAGELGSKEAPTAAATMLLTGLAADHRAGDD